MFYDSGNCIKSIRNENQTQVHAFCNTSEIICYRNWLGQTGLHVAAKVCNPVIFKILLNVQPNCLNSKSRWTRRTAYQMTRFPKWLGGCNSNYGMIYQKVYIIFLIRY